MPSARRSTEPARPVSEIPILNAALLNTEADVVAALVVPEPDVVPPVVEVPGAVVVAPVDVPGAVVPVGETVGLKKFSRSCNNVMKYHLRSCWDGAA